MTATVEATPQPAPPGAQVFHTLDAFRGIAALFVVAGHVGVMYLGDRAIPGSSYLAVDIFFVLSGFVIAYAYGPRLERGLSWAGFTRIRLIRFYPLFLLGMAMGAVWWLGRGAVEGDGRGPAGIIAGFSQFFFVPDPASDGLLFPFNGPAWSLFAELAVNIVYAIFWRRIGPRVLALIIALGAGAVVWTAIHYGSLDAGFSWDQLPGLTARVVFGFFAGVGLYRLYAAGRRGPALPGLALFAVLALAMVIRPPEGFRAAYDLLFVLVAAPALIWLGASSLTGRAVTVIGRFSARTSYSVYILHQPILLFIGSADSRLLDRALQAAAPLSGVCMVIALVAAAYVADAFYDKPVRRWLTARSGALQHRPGAAARN